MIKKTLLAVFHIWKYAVKIVFGSQDDMKSMETKGTMK